MNDRIAISSHALTRFSVEESLAFVAPRFKGWEIVGEGGHHLPDIEPALRALLPSYDLKVSVHTPLSDVNIGSLNPRMRDQAMKEVISSIEVAGRLGFGPFTLHPGFYTPLGMVDREEARHVTIASIKAIDKVAKENSVTVALENMPDMPISMVKTPDELLSMIEGTEMKVCLDIGHANTTRNIHEYLGLKDLIVNIHIHDNMGKYDQHLPIGDGNIDFAPIISKLSSYKGRYVIEARRLEDASTSKERLNDLLSHH
ncbi:MAG: sugar phosphate isomerase/epimerase [Methanomassiliicoccales archaeon]|nr:MAG: sugar phosphate isomerase/epimerase [Methanomassiliicoccales archaeon]